MTIFYRWGNCMGLDMKALCPAWTGHAERMLARPSFARAFAAEGITLGGVPA